MRDFLSRLTGRKPKFSFQEVESLYRILEKYLDQKDKNLDDMILDVSNETGLTIENIKAALYQDEKIKIIMEQLEVTLKKRQQAHRDAIDWLNSQIEESNN